MDKGARNKKLLVEAIDSHLKNSDRWRSEEDGIDEQLPFWSSYNRIAKEYDDEYYKECLPVLKLIIIVAALLSAAEVATTSSSNPNDPGLATSVVLDVLQQLVNSTDFTEIVHAELLSESQDPLNWVTEFGAALLWFVFVCTLSIAVIAFAVIMDIGARRRQVTGKVTPKKMALCRQTFYEDWGPRRMTYVLAACLAGTVVMYFVATMFSNPIDRMYSIYGPIGLCVVAVVGGFRIFRNAREKQTMGRLRVAPDSMRTAGPLRYRYSVEGDIRMIVFAASQTSQVEQHRQDFMHILRALFTIPPVLFVVSRHRRLLSAVPWADIFEFLCAKYVAEGPKSLDQHDEEDISDIAQILVFLTMPGMWQGSKITRDFLKGIQESDMEGVRGDAALLISLAGTRRGAFQSDFDSLWNQYCVDATKIPQSTTRWFIRSAPPLPSTQVLAESVLRVDQCSDYTIDELQNFAYFLTEFTALMVPEQVKLYDKHSACMTLSSYSTLMASVASWNPALETLDSQVHLYYARMAGKDVKHLNEFWSLVDSGTWSPLRVDVIHALLYGLTQVLPTAILYPTSRQDIVTAEYQDLVAKHVGPLLAALSPPNLPSRASSVSLLEEDPAKWLISTIGRLDDLLTGQYPDDWTTVTSATKEDAEKPPISPETTNIAKITGFIGRGINHIHRDRVSVPFVEDYDPKHDLEACSTALSSTIGEPQQPPRSASPAERGTILRLLTEHLIPICQFLIPIDIDFSPHQTELEGLTDPSLRIVASVISGMLAIELVSAVEVSKPVDPALVTACSFLVARIDLIHSSKVVQLATALLLIEDEAACLALASALLDRPEIFGCQPFDARTHSDTPGQNNDSSNVFAPAIVRRLLEVGASPEYQVESITTIQRLIHLPWVPTLFIDQGGMEFLSLKITNKNSSVAEAVLDVVLHVLSSLRDAEDLKSAVCATEKAHSVLVCQDTQYGRTDLAAAFTVAAASILSDTSPASTIWRPTVAGLVGRLKVPSAASP